MRLADHDVTCALCHQPSAKAVLLGDNAACFACLDQVVRYVLPFLFLEADKPSRVEPEEILPYIGTPSEDHRIGGWEAA